MVFAETDDHKETDRCCHAHTGLSAIVRSSRFQFVHGLPSRPCDPLSMVVATSFEPIIQPSIGPFSKVTFKATLATQPGEIPCPRSGNDKPCRLDLAVLDDF